MGMMLKSGCTVAQSLLFRQPTSHSAAKKYGQPFAETKLKRAKPPSQL